MNLEVNPAFKEASTTFTVPGGHTFSMTPPLNGDYWLARVPVSATQAVICFPKFFTIGIGFQVEEDWNTNLPYTCSAEEIYEHIAHNQGDVTISDDDCIEAIRLLQSFAANLEKAVKA